MKAVFDDNTMAPWRSTEPSAVILGELEIRIALPDEMQRVATLLDNEHYLGAGRQVGVLNQQQRIWLNLPPKLIGRTGRRAPSYQALYNLLGKLDPNDLADTLNFWLAAHHGTLPRAIALDGKYIRDLLLTLAINEAQRIASAASPLLPAKQKIVGTVDYYRTP